MKACVVVTCFLMIPRVFKKEPHFSFFLQRTAAALGCLLISSKRNTLIVRVGLWSHGRGKYFLSPEHGQKDGLSQVCTKYVVVASGQMVSGGEKGVGGGGGVELCSIENLLSLLSQLSTGGTKGKTRFTTADSQTPVERKGGKPKDQTTHHISIASRTRKQQNFDETAIGLHIIVCDYFERDLPPVCSAHISVVSRLSVSVRTWGYLGSHGIHHIAEPRRRFPPPPPPNVLNGGGAVSLSKGIHFSCWGARSGACGKAGFSHSCL